MTNSIFLQRIPDEVYAKVVTFLTEEYHFLNGVENGGRMRLANYFVGVPRSVADSFRDFIQEIITKNSNNFFPNLDVPIGFDTQNETLTDLEKTGDFSFGSFDMAVTDHQLQNIEFQALATYPFTAAKLNLFIQDQLNLENTQVFADKTPQTWEGFLAIYQQIIGGKNQDSVVLTDRKLKNQKTNFEFYATQKELGLPVEIVDIEAIFEKNQSLFYTTANNETKKIKRLYNRILVNEAIYDDNYPAGAKWQMRYDKLYQDLTFINHPKRIFEISKRLLPYLKHPFNPPALELNLVAEQFLNGSLAYTDYVWKHKDGAAGFSLFLSPNQAILEGLIADNTLHYYIAQSKINYKIFKTDDGLEKIIELRFMTAHTKNALTIVPMARIGHCTKETDDSITYKIHFGDNNKLGYGFAPTLIFDD